MRKPKRMAYKVRPCARRRHHFFAPARLPFRSPRPPAHSPAPTQTVSSDQTPSTPSTPSLGWGVWPRSRRRVRVTATSPTLSLACLACLAFEFESLPSGWREGAPPGQGRGGEGEECEKGLDRDGAYLEARGDRAQDGAHREPEEVAGEVGAWGG